MTLKQGQHLNDRYWIAMLVEQGGFGAVYKAWDIVLNHPCALKESYELSPEGQRQFLREAQLLANLAHPNLPRVTDYFTIPEQGQYLVMDFVEGKNLEELRLLAGGRLPEGQALGWITQVLDALVYIHRQDPPVIHRDIKPANIKITPPDENYPQGRAVLVDFGVAKAYDSYKRTTMGARAVTPGYSPYEQYGQSSALTDARTDIYALGATLYTLLTGQEPPESVIRLLRDPLAPPRQLNPALSLQTEAVILKAMHNDPDERYQKASEFKAAIGGLLPVIGSQQPVVGSPQPEVSSPTPAVVVEQPTQSVVEEVYAPSLQPVVQPAVPASPTGGAPGRAGMIPVNRSGVPAGVGVSGGSLPTPPVGMRTAQPARRSSTWKWLGLVAGIAVVTVLASRWIRNSSSGQLTPVSSINARVKTVTPLAGSTQISPVDGMVLSYIPGGTFQMGSESAFGDERPAHAVRLDAFWMDQTEVTNEMYARCVVDSACSPHDGYDTSSYTRDSYYGNVTYADFPVIYVKWDQAAAYCTWAGRELPTEAQWEYAARGGLVGALYPWGNEAPGCALGAQNGAQYGNCLRDDTIAAASFAPNYYGLYDMAGNVMEWVADWYSRTYYSISPVSNPTGPDNGNYKVLRGGGWRYGVGDLRVADRNYNDPLVKTDHVGFRCAASPGN